MKKPHLFYLTTSLNIGGTEKFLVSLIGHLRSEFDFSVGYMKEKGALGERLSRGGIPVERYGNLVDLRRRLLRGDIDLVHTFLYRANIIGRLAGKLAGIPVVSTQQAIDAWKKPWHVWLDSWTARYADRIVANSRATRELLIRRERIAPEKIRVVYNGIDAGSSIPRGTREDILGPLGIDPSAYVVACVTRLHEEKGADLLPEIAARVPGSVFLIIGDGPARRQIEEKCAALPPGRCVLTGWRNDIFDLLGASNAFVLPSREESFPQAILEAMTVRLPVLAADVGGVNELVEHGRSGVLISPGAVDRFAEALNFLKSHPEIARAMGNEGYTRSCLFGEKEMVERIRSLYNELLP